MVLKMVKDFNIKFKLHHANDRFPDALTPSYMTRSDWQAHFWNSREPGPRILIWIINWLTTLATNLIYIDFRLGIDLIKWKVYFYDERINFHSFIQFVYGYVAYNKSPGLIIYIWSFVFNYSYFNIYIWSFTFYHLYLIIYILSFVFDHLHLIICIWSFTFYHLYFITCWCIWLLSFSDPE